MSAIATSRSHPPRPPAIRRRSSAAALLLAAAVIAMPWLGAPLQAASIQPEVVVVVDPPESFFGGPGAHVIVHVRSDVPGAPPPTGSVDITVEPDTNTETIPLDATGSAVAPMGRVVFGVNPVIVSYPGDATYLPALGFATFTIGFTPTDVAVSSSPNPSTVGQPVTFTYATRVDGEPVDPGFLPGFVEITDLTTGVGSGFGPVAVAGTITLTFATPGTHRLLFHYSGSVIGGLAPGGGTVDQVVLPPVDTQPPRIVVGVLHPVLTEDDHQLIDVGLLMDARDNVRVIDIDISVTQNEPVRAGPGDPSPDAVVRTDSAGHILGLSVRSERADNGHGRVYLVTTTAIDTSGNRSSASTAVVVPRSTSIFDLFDVVGQALAAVTAGVPLPYDSLAPAGSG